MNTVGYPFVKPKPVETRGHIANNGGLRGHSVDPDHNLLKRYVIFQPLYKTNGDRWAWLGRDSFDTWDEAIIAIEKITGKGWFGIDWKVENNFTGESWH